MQHWTSQTCWEVSVFELCPANTADPQQQQKTAKTTNVKSLKCFFCPTTSSKTQETLHSPPHEKETHAFLHLRSQNQRCFGAIWCKVCLPKSYTWLVNHSSALWRFWKCGFDSHCDIKLSAAGVTATKTLSSSSSSDDDSRRAKMCSSQRHAV